MQATPDYRIAVNGYTGSHFWRVRSVSAPDSESTVDEFNEGFVFSEFLSLTNFRDLLKIPSQMVIGIGPN